LAPGSSWATATCGGSSRNMERASGARQSRPRIDTVAPNLLHRLIMSGVSFDPTGFYEFSLETGSVKSRDGARVVMVSDSVLATLVSGAVERGDVTAVR